MIEVDTSRHLLHAFGQSYRVAIGKGGTIEGVLKREGDGATPLGEWRVLGAMLRPDRLSAPHTLLPWRWIRQDDGWCDAVSDPAYNRPVNRPYPASAETLWRDDHAYDVIIVLDHNQFPVVPGHGSAIFWHVAQPDWRGTEGCVAMEREALLGILPLMREGMPFRIF